MTRACVAVLWSVAGLLAPAASAQSVAWFSEGGPYSLKAGSTFQFPSVSVNSGSSTPASGNVRLTLTGGCGTFGGSPTVSVPLVPSLPLYLATPPAFTATTPGTCTLEASFPSYSMTASMQVVVYNGATVHPVPQYARVAMPANTTRDLSVLVVDDGGRGAPGYHVLYESDIACGRYESKNAESHGIEGLAYSPTYRSTTVLGPCKASATLVETGAKIDLPTLIFDDKAATIAVAPASVSTSFYQPFTVKVSLHAQDGTPLPAVKTFFHWRSESATGGAQPSYTAGSATTDANGDATFYLNAGGTAGTYELEFSALDRTYRVPVAQAVRPPDPPPPPPVLVPGTKGLQDMWWVGPGENGWGMSIVQHTQNLFAVAYVYDAEGKPTWYVIPTGIWDIPLLTFHGASYNPRGSPYFAYDASRFSSGEPVVANSTLTFNARNVDVATGVTFNMDLRSVFVNKKLVRSPFGAVGPARTPEVGDMWWGGPSQNGWGLAILQQYSALFAIWFTYDANGMPTWFVMPDGAWTSADTFEGRAYRTESSAWRGVTYDASKLKVFDVGSFKLRFTGDAATFDYDVEGHRGSHALSRTPF